MGMLDLFAAGARELRWRTDSTNPQNPAYWLTRMFGQQTSTGITVTDDLALSVTTVYSAIRNLSDDIGTLPYPVYEETPSGERGRKVRSHPTARILNGRANPEMPASALRTTVQGHAVLRGNGYAEIEFDSAERPKAMWPLITSRMRLVRNGRDVEVQGLRDGGLVYEYTLPSGERRLFAPERIFHLRGFGSNGLEGYSFLRYGAESIAAAAAIRAYGGAFFGNDATPPLVLKTAGQIDEDTGKKLRSSFEAMHRPLENKHRMAILEGGLELEKIGINPEEAQAVDFRKYARSDLAEWVRMPPDKVGDFDRMTFTNAEHSDIFYVKYTLRSWFVRWDQETNSKLLPSGLVAEHNAEGFLRGDTKTRSESYRERFNASSITPGEIRRIENQEPTGAPGEDQLWFPMNMKPASAYDANGMTLLDKVNAASVLVKAGYDPAAAAAAVGLPPIAHTGLVPVTVTVDPATLEPGKGASA